MCNMYYFLESVNKRAILPVKSVPPKRSSKHFCLYITGQNIVMWPCIAASEPRKYGLLA